MDNNDLAKIVDSRIPAPAAEAKPKPDWIVKPQAVKSPIPIHSITAPEEDEPLQIFSDAIQDVVGATVRQAEYCERWFRQEISKYILELAKQSEEANNDDDDIMSHYLFRRLDEISGAVDNLRAILIDILNTEPETIIKRYKD